jgi:hypothetical protein
MPAALEALCAKFIPEQKLYEDLGEHLYFVVAAASPTPREMTASNGPLGIRSTRDAIGHNDGLFSLKTR